MQVAARAWLPHTIQEAGLQAVLRQVYMQYTLLHGCLREMLVRSAAADKLLLYMQYNTMHACIQLTESCQCRQLMQRGLQAALQSVLNETATRLLRPKSKDLLSLQSPLGMLTGIPWLPLDSHIFSGEQHDHFYAF